jgi:hypothetical protein
MPTADEMIAFLLDRKYPDHRLLRIKIKRALQLGVSSSAELEQRTKVAAYEACLSELSLEALEGLYEEELALQEAERVRESRALHEKAEKIEADRFFNRPHAKADFEHWAKASYWTLEEAVALILGRAPEHVTWDRVKDHVHASPFAFLFSRVRDLALRAEFQGELQDSDVPLNFLRWAKGIDIVYPAELEEQLAARGQTVLDWKTLHNQVVQRHDELALRAQRASEEASRTISELRDRVATLEAERDAFSRDVEELKNSPRTPDGSASDLKARERGTLLKLVLGMAKGGYGYDPAKSRSTIAEDIVSDLAMLGISVSHDTVRKWLKEAAKLLPSAAIEDASTKPN